MMKPAAPTLIKRRHHILIVSWMCIQLILPVLVLLAAYKSIDQILAFQTEFSFLLTPLLLATKEFSSARKARIWSIDL